LTRRWLAALVAGTVAACATPPAAPPPPRMSERIILLPSESGRPTSIVVMRGNSAVELSRPYAMAAVAVDRIEPSDVDAALVSERYGGLLAAQPRSPKTFTLLFVFDTDAFTERSKATFVEVREEVASWPGAEVVIIGHSDRVGSSEYNDALSLKRAAMVARHLINAGVPPGRISIAGRGEREPLVPTTDGVPEPLNRRVEIKVR
jgi:outer membrane protein OmpA-like peptidoglycan-associated protein